MKHEYTNFCGCDDSRALESEVLRLKEIIKQLNDHRPETARGGQIGIVTYLLPVERVKIARDRKRLEWLEKENKRLHEFRDRLLNGELDSLLKLAVKEAK